MKEYRIIVTLTGGNVVTLENLSRPQVIEALIALKHHSSGWTSLDRPGANTVHINRSHIVCMVDEEQT